jgi:hypothetical protein
MRQIIFLSLLFLSLLVVAKPVLGLTCSSGCSVHVNNTFGGCGQCGYNSYGACITWCSIADMWCECDGQTVPGSKTSCPDGYWSSVDGTCHKIGEDTTSDGSDGCTPSCPSASSGVCGTVGNGCGGKCSCIECDTCTPQCGQASDCGTCGTADDGAPEAPTLVESAGTITNPAVYDDVTGTDTVINLSWSSNSDLTDYYQVYVKDSNEATVWSSAVGATGVGSSGYTAGLYHWYVQAVNSTCDASDIGATSAYGYLVVNNPPVIESLVIRNADWEVVPLESGDRNQICQSTFINSSNSRRIIFEVSIEDPNGWTEVSNTVLSWNGSSYIMDELSGSGTGVTMVSIIDFGTDSNNSGVFPITVSTGDSYGVTKTTKTFGGLKVWDCQVPVSGVIYDGSGGQACNDIGFVAPVDVNFGFSSLVFKDVGGSDDVSISTSLPANYGPTNITYGKTYLPTFNGGDTVNPDGTVLGTGRITRLIDLEVGTTQCPSESQINLENGLSAYATNPRAQVDFSYLKDQEAWFQVNGAGVKAKSWIDSGVPVTVNSSSRALSILGTYADNGLVSFVNYKNINGFNDESGYGLPNNWWVNRNTNDSNSYGYQYFYNNFLINNGVGVTGTDWSGKPSEGVYFVNGNLNIDSDFALDPGKTMIVVVSGKITIAETVSRIDGIYIANNGIEALGASANQLVINGMLYSKGNIRLARSFTDKMQNNTTPAVKINYQPGLIFNLPGKLMRVLSDWQEE